MAYKKQCDRTWCIRLNKALLRASQTLVNPSWVNLLPSNNEDSKLYIPEKGESLLPAIADLWFAVAKMCLSDLQRQMDDISFEDYQRHMIEISDHLSQWATKAQGPRADSRKR